MLAFLSYTFEVHPMLGEKVACAAISPHLYTLSYIQVLCYPPFRSCTQPSFGDKLTGEHRRNRESADVRRHDHRQIAVERGRRRHGRQPQSPVTQQQIDKILWNLPRLRAQSHATKRYPAVQRPQVTHAERIGPVLFCAACGSAAASHS